MRETFSLRSLPYLPLLTAAGILLIALVFIAANPHLRTARAPQPARRAPPAMMVASRPIAAGTIISPADLGTKSYEGAPPAGAVTSREAAVGLTTTKKFAAGEMLRQEGLRDAASLGIAARVPEGERAFSIRVAEDEIVGGFLQSGDHVDIFATIPGSAFPAIDAQTMPDRSQAVLLQQNVLVLAVGENPATRGSVQAAARTVTLSLPPARLARVTLALRFGKVSLAIRRPGDTEVAEVANATLTDLVPPPRPAAQRQHDGIPFYAGAHSGALADGAP
jgi:pilus assembly protein CpaB